MLAPARSPEGAVCCIMACWMLPAPPLPSRGRGGGEQPGLRGPGGRRAPSLRRAGARRVPCPAPRQPGGVGRRRDCPPRASRCRPAHLPPGPGSRRGRAPPRPPRWPGRPPLPPPQSRRRGPPGAATAALRDLGWIPSPGRCPGGAGRALPLRLGRLRTGQGRWR